LKEFFEVVQQPKEERRWS